MDLGRLRKAFPKLVIIGNIRSQLIHTGTPAEIEAEVRECLDDAVRLGGIIAGVSNYIVPGTPAENIDALLEAFIKYN